MELDILVISQSFEGVRDRLSVEKRFRITGLRSGEEAIAWLSGKSWPDLMLLDLDMPGMDGIETLEKLQNTGCYAPVVMLSSGQDDLRRVVTAVRLGACDYLLRSSSGESMCATILKYAAKCNLSGKHPAGAETLQDGSVFVTASPSMIALRANLEQIGPTDFPVLCLGESGVGKEVIARLVHSLSPRSNRRFEKVNCAAVPPDLLESELFGYERGAFTGAVRSKPGRFELCHRGTIFLDEIGEMPPAVQAKLLHVLQDGEFHRLGGSAKIRVDVRVIAATNVDVHRAIAAKRFREDLYYRLNTFTFHLPPLRDRREDIPVLLRHFLRRHGSENGIRGVEASPAALAYCMAYDWPGNVRELENFAKRYLILGDSVLATHRPRELSALQEDAGPFTIKLKAKIRDLKEDAEAQAISRALKQTRWNRKQAAALLQISYKSLLIKVRQYGLDGNEPVDFDQAMADWTASTRLGSPRLEGSPGRHHSAVAAAGSGPAKT